MSVKTVICIAIAALFAGLAIGLNVGNQFDDLPNLVSVACLGVVILFGIIASAFHKKEKGK